MGFSTEITSKFYQYAYIYHVAHLFYSLHKTAAVLLTTSAFGSLNNASSLLWSSHLFFVLFCFTPIIHSDGLGYFGYSSKAELNPGDSNHKLPGCVITFPVLFPHSQRTLGIAIFALSLFNSEIWELSMLKMWNLHQEHMKSISPWAIWTLVKHDWTSEPVGSWCTCIFLGSTLKFQSRSLGMRPRNLHV